MAERFRLELAYSLDQVGVRVIAKPSGWDGPSADLKVAGWLTPEAAIAFADALRAKAESVAARNSKKAAEEERRRARSAKLPKVSWR